MEDPDAALSPPLHHHPEESSRRLSGLRNVFNLNLNRRRLQNAPAAERIAALQRMRSDNELQQQQRQQQRQRRRLSQRIAANADADADDDDGNHANGETVDAHRRTAAFSGDGIDGFANDEATNNALHVTDESSRRRSRMSWRLQEVFGVRTRRPESAVFAASATASATVSAPITDEWQQARAAGTAEAADGPASTNSEQVSTTTRPTVALVNANNHDP